MKHSEVVRCGQRNEALMKTAWCISTFELSSKPTCCGVQKSRVFGAFQVGAPVGACLVLFPQQQTYPCTVAPTLNRLSSLNQLINYHGASPQNTMAESTSTGWPQRVVMESKIKLASAANMSDEKKLDQLLNCTFALALATAPEEPIDHYVKWTVLDSLKRVLERANTDGQ